MTPWPVASRDAVHAFSSMRTGMSASRENGTPDPALDVASAAGGLAGRWLLGSCVRLRCVGGLLGALLLALGSVGCRSLLGRLSRFRCRAGLDLLVGQESDRRVRRVQESHRL